MTMKQRTKTGGGGGWRQKGGVFNCILYTVYWGVLLLRTCSAPTRTASMRGLVPSAAQMGVKAAVDMGGGVWGEGGY